MHLTLQEALNSKLEEIAVIGSMEWTCNDTCPALQSEGDKVIIAERGQLVFLFNFHPTNSYNDYRVGCPVEGPYKVPVYQLQVIIF